MTETNTVENMEPIKETAAAPAPRERGYVDHLCRLNREWFVMHGWFPGKAGDVRVVVLDGTGNVRPTPAPSRATCVAYPRPDAPIPDERAGKIMVACVPGGLSSDESFGMLLAGEAGPIRLGPPHWETVEMEPAAFVERLAPFSGEVREAFQAAMMSLADSACGIDTDDVFRLNQRRAELHVAMRKPAPTAAAGRDTNGLAVESLLTLDGKTFLITGWLWCDDAPPARLTAISPEGFRVELLPAIHRFLRPDIEQLYGIPSAGLLGHNPGFAAFFEVRAPFGSTTSLGWVLELTDARQQTIETPCPRVIRSAPVFEEALLALSNRSAEASPEDVRLKGPLGEALLKTRGMLRDVTRFAIKSFGRAADAPTTTLILSAGARPGVIEHQLAAFSADPDLKTVQIIYIVDAAQPSTWFDAKFDMWLDLYRVPFTVLLSTGRSGRTAGIEMALGQADAARVLIGLAGVIPTGPGWLTELNTAMDGPPRRAMVGPTLVNEDGTIVHAGLECCDATSDDRARVKRSHEGLPLDMAGVGAGPVGAGVALDWALLDRATLRQVGGLNAAFFLDDYAAFDVSSRLARAGFETAHVPHVRLVLPTTLPTDPGPSPAHSRFDARLLHQSRAPVA